MFDKQIIIWWNKCVFHEQLWFYYCAAEFYGENSTRKPVLYFENFNTITLFLIQIKSLLGNQNSWCLTNLFFYCNCPDLDLENWVFLGNWIFHSNLFVADCSEKKGFATLEKGKNYSATKLQLSLWWPLKVQGRDCPDRSHWIFKLQPQVLKILTYSASDQPTLIACFESICTCGTPTTSTSDVEPRSIHMHHCKSKFGVVSVLFRFCSRNHISRAIVLSALAMVLHPWGMMVPLAVHGLSL